MPNEQENNIEDTSQYNDTPVRKTIQPLGPSDRPVEVATPETSDTPDIHMAARAESEPSTAELATAGSTAAASFTQPAASTSEPYSNGPAPTKKSKKATLIIASAIAAVFLLGSGAAAYNLGFQNPDKVIGDALGNALSAESASTDTVMSIESKDPTSSVGNIDVSLKTLNNLEDASVDGSVSINGDGANFKVSGSAVVKGNDKFFVKANDLKETIEKSGLSALLGSSPSINKLIEKLDGNWVVVSQKDFEDVTGAEEDATKCVEDVAKKIRSGSDSSNELRDLYKKYPLIGVKKALGSKDGSLGYEIEFKRQNAIKFVNGVNSTKFFEELKKCDKSIQNLNGEEIFKNDSTDEGDVKAVVWVDRWSHQFTKLELTGTSDEVSFSATTKPKFDVEVKIEEPKGAITVDDIKGDIEAIQQDVMQSYMLPNPTSSSSAIET